ncbi:MAG: ATP synthase F0 subunit C [Polyangia bacterium]|jgi:F-type H+-transporting ATPase subunit c
MRRVARTFVPLALFVLTALSSAAAWAEGAAPAAGNSQGLIAIGAALAIGLAALGGGLGQGRAAASALDGIARNPQASGKIFVPMIVALALIESLVIYGLLIAFNLSGKL